MEAIGYVVLMDGSEIAPLREKVEEARFDYEEVRLLASSKTEVIPFYYWLAVEKVVRILKGFKNVIHEGKKVKKPIYTEKYFPAYVKDQPIEHFDNEVNRHRHGH